MWSALPTQLRTVLGAALLLVIGVAIASFTLSFIALREVASNPAFGWGKQAWIFPACVDMALVASEVVLIGASMVRGVNRAVPFVLMVLFGALTVWFNVERVPSEWRIITATPPLAGIFMTLLIAYLVKILARVTGTAWEHDAPPPAYGLIGGYGSPIQGAVWRQDGYPQQVPPPWAPYGHLGSPTTSTNGHNGHALEGGEASDATKRALVDLYLSRRTPEQLQVETGSSIVDGVAREHGVTVSNREALRQLDSFRSTQPAAKRRR
jgi:hypothetical protein